MSADEKPVTPAAQFARELAISSSVGATKPT